MKRLCTENLFLILKKTEGVTIFVKKGFGALCKHIRAKDSAILRFSKK